MKKDEVKKDSPSIIKNYLNRIVSIPANMRKAVITVNKRKAEVKKARPNLIKTYLNWIIAIPATWMLAHFYVDFYHGVWPHEGLIQFGFDVFEKYPKLTGSAGGGIGALAGIYHWYEIYRKRT